MLFFATHGHLSSVSTADHCLVHMLLAVSQTLTEYQDGQMTVVPYLDVGVVPDVSNDRSVSATLACWEANYAMLLNSSHAHNQRVFDTSTSASFLKPEFPSIFIYGQWSNLAHTSKVWHKRVQRLGQWIHSAVMQQKRHNGLNVVANSVSTC